MDDKYPYKKAKLVHHKRDLSKRWYAYSWVWDIELNKLVPRKYYTGINRYHSISVNMQWRIIFIWRNGHAYDVKMIDYH